MAQTIDPKEWLEAQCAEYVFQPEGIFQSSGDHPWPLIAEHEAELLQKLKAGGHILPLPKEAAALANVLEVSLVSFLTNRADALSGGHAQQGTERGYPDFELFGSAFGETFHAVDVKVAKRAVNKAGKATGSTKSRITLYTGNTYFRHPQEKFPGTFRPFDDYASHLDVICVYTFDESSPSRVADLELIVQEPWRIASKQRSSTTREYIGAVQKINDLRNGNGAFTTPAEFYSFWRKYPFKTAPVVVQTLLKKH